MTRMLRSIGGLGVAIALLAGCSQIQGVVDDALSAALRTAASEALKQAAEQNGHPLKADPVCSGSVKSQDKSADLACTAETQDGLPVAARVAVTNAGDFKTCKGEMSIKIGNEPEFSQKFANCGG